MTKCPDTPKVTRNIFYILRRISYSHSNHNAIHIVEKSPLIGDWTSNQLLIGFETRPYHRLKIVQIYFG